MPITILRPLAIFWHLNGVQLGFKTVSLYLEDFDLTLAFLDPLGQFNFFFRCKKRYLFKPFQILPGDIMREKREFLFQFLLSLYLFSSFSLQAFLCCLDFKFFQ